MSTSTRAPNAVEEDRLIAQGVDDEPPANNQRTFAQRAALFVSVLSAAYAFWHVFTLNVSPVETWAFRILHVAGALCIGFLAYSAATVDAPSRGNPKLIKVLAALLALPALYSLVIVFQMSQLIAAGEMIEPDMETWQFGIPLAVTTVGAVLCTWLLRPEGNKFNWLDATLVLAVITSTAYLMVHLDGSALRMRAGTPFASPGNAWAAMTGLILILELTRRVAGGALVVISAIFVLYSFVGPYLPGFLTHDGFDFSRFFSYIYTDAGVLGATTAVSSTYIILFIVFAAFLQASKVGDYFVNFAFAAAGRARGGPAKVAVFASGLMGMINGTSAGNVVATGSLTIPLMKKVGYNGKTAGAIEAAASTGGQIMPPIMGAGAFIMAEITGIPYSDIAIAAIIPAVLYFLSTYLMVDFEAAKLGMRGMRSDELPQFSKMVKQIYLFIPIIILIVALFMGYSVIRAGTLATTAAAVVSWLTPVKMGPKSIFKAFDMAGVMSIQIITVCACAGIIVGVIALTGVGARFSSILLDIAENSQLIALFFAMCIAILLGMGMPTTAAYAVAASVVAPGLIELGIQPLVAHFFVFYFAVISAITPPVALASYAAAGISGANPMATSFTSFKIGLTAFIVPFMFFYNAALLMEGEWFVILRAFVTACIGVFFLAAAIQGWFWGAHANWIVRGILLIAALCMIEGGLYTDIGGALLAIVAIILNKFFKGKAAPNPMVSTRGMD
ncbi:TRAP transporter 4TM/12TM fusion protein [Limnobacter thiooxidans]|uniref:TRAP transporter permease n=1 Tax=Limnobacter thiooxidans TaxID=131080 RepID=A0AA86MB40_9BURK|nr:TRAP transporter 4TM/12TM fusion protein [Limnobacter thiooxidans]BET25798.1 TRAP transporter permease [Limnobacter thiooxidans]